MIELNKDASLIKVHGREGLVLPFARYQKSGTGRETQIDISASTIYFECPAADLRVQLVANPGDAMGLLIKLTRTQVETLPLTASDFAIVDETNVTYPEVEWTGKIQRVGYVGTP